MNETQAQQLIDAVSRQNQLLEGIDWKLWKSLSTLSHRKKRND